MYGAVMKQVAAAVIQENNKVLIAKRRKGLYLEGKWEFPGGKVESGETPEQGLKRELSEEFGIEADIGEFICRSMFEYKHISIELLAYRARRVSGEFILTDHDQIKWVIPKHLEQYDLADADKPVVEVLKSL